MDENRWNRIQEIFAEALAAPPDKRSKLLEDQCADDGELRAEVQSLIDAAGTGGGLIGEAVQSAAQQIASGETEGRIGGFRIIRLLGEGGMGSVYLATRQDQIEMQVAIKLMQAGSTSTDLLAGFAAEQKILASLEHPNIARFLDAGHTAAGQPYLVMEYVDGQPLLEYCRERGTTTAGRLRIFQKICEAVRYAHQNLVIHRDIKPANILVTPQGEPKLLDFGIAKLLDSGAPSGQNTLTLPRQLTPAYASPEQIRGERSTTASDVYSLGVVLFELLTEARPYEVTGQSFSEMERAICETPPTPPHTLLPELRGDLEIVILKAMQKEPARRYGSAGEFADDIERYLGNYPIKARADSWAYSFRKFVRRNPWGVGAVAAFAILVLAFGITTAVILERVRQERDVAERTAQFLVSVFRVADPTEARGNQVTAREVLDKASERISSDLNGQPVVKGRMMFSLGLVYESLGLYERAGQLLKQSIDLRKQTVGNGHWDTADSVLGYSNVLLQAGRLPQAEETALEALAIRRNQAGAKADLYEGALRHLGDVYRSRGKYPEAEAALREVLAICRKSYAPDDQRTGQAMHGLAKTLLALGRFEEAEPLLRDAVAIDRKVLGADSPQFATSLNNYALALRDKGDYRAATPLFEEAYTIYRKVYGEDHGYTAIAMSNIGGVLEAAGDAEKGVEWQRRSYAIHKKVQREGHPFISRAAGNLAHTLHSAGQTKEAEAVYKESLRGWGKSDSSTAAVAMLGYAGLLADERRYPEAEPYFRRALEIIRMRHPKGNVMWVPVLSAYGLTMLETGRAAEAEPLVRQARELADRLPGDHWHKALARIAWAAWLGANGRFAEAEAEAAQAVERLRRQPGPSYPETKLAQRVVENLKAAANSPRRL